MEPFKTSRWLDAEPVLFECWTGTNFPGGHAYSAAHEPTPAAQRALVAHVGIDKTEYLHQRIALFDQAAMWP